VRFWKQVSLIVPVGLGVVVMTFLATAWFEIQAVRWGYKAQKVRQEIDDLSKKEETLDQRLQQNLSLSRLDALARTKFGLQAPGPAQIVLLTDPGDR